jgi:hypothetical protein
MNTCKHSRLQSNILAPVIWLLILSTALPTHADEWQAVFDGDGVFVEQRNYDNSPLMELRGRTRLKASLNAVMALLKDADYNRHWVFRSGGARILQASGYAQAYVHGVVDAPWPMQDRDTVVRFDYAQHLLTRIITITISNHPEFIPHQAGLVRVPDFGGFWQLSPLEGGYVDVIYQVHGNPGGWVPTWLANYAAQISVLQTLRNMPVAVARYYSAADSGEVTELTTR